MMPPRAPRSLLFAALCALLACGGKQKSGDVFFGDHVVHGEREKVDRRIPELSAEEAEARMAGAIEDGEPDALVYASRMVAAGRVLTVDVREALRALIDDSSAAELEDRWPQLEPGVPPAPMVALRLALLARHRGDDDAALSWLDAIGADAAVAARASEIRDEIEARRSVDAGAVAVLLPLSGRYGSLGREVRAAVEAAAGRYGEAGLVYLDTEGDPARAVEAVERAVYEHRVAAILGPVGQEVSRAAAARAAELGVPIALLAPADDGAAPEARVFRLWSSPVWEARMAAAAAVHLDYDRLAVFSPRDEQGRAQAAAFRAEAAERGVEIVAAADYDPTATDLEPDVKELLGLDPTENARLRRHLRRHGKKGWKSFTPDVPFDLLYIPDRHDRAALVASFLPYFNVELRSTEITDPVHLRRKYRGKIPQVVQLLGSSGWHHPGLIPRGGPAVDGALVIDVYVGGDDEPFADEGSMRFAEAFERTTGRQPTGVAAQAHDAAALVLLAHREAAGAPDPRRALAEALLDVRLTDGACGPAAVTTSGELDREPLILQVESGQFVLHEY